MAERERFIDDIPGYLRYYAFRGGGWLVDKLPLKASFAVAVAAAEISYLFSREKRTTVYRNMSLVRPEGGPKEWRRLARLSFYNYARYWVNFLRCFYTPFEEIYHTMTVPHGTYWFDEALKKKRGVVLALPHYGSWDIIGGWVGHNYPSFWAVAEQLKPRPMYEFHTELRRRMGIRIIPLGEGAVQEVIRVLADNGMVCLLSDRLIAGSGVEVEFFGQKVRLPIGPALLAIKMGTTVIPCQIIRRDGRYHGNVGPPLEIEVSGDTRRDVQVNTQKLARIFEGYIREDPTQWHMFQPIFSDSED